MNAPHGKNLVGSYYAPIRIVVDTDVLQTLEDWLLPDGMGEIVKHALCQDVDLLHYLEQYDGKLNDPVFLDYVVRRTIELKCEVSRGAEGTDRQAGSGVADSHHAPRRRPHLAGDRPRPEGAP